jgi:hypothetical protein
MLSDTTYNGGLTLSTRFVLNGRQEVDILERQATAPAGLRPL